MKKLFLFVCMAASLTAFAEMGPLNSSTNLDGAGNVIGGTLEQRFINVKNRYGNTLSRGAVVVWDTSNDDGYSVTTSTTAGAYPACILAVACSSGSLCKCQTYGYHSEILFKREGSDATAGQKMFLSETTGGYINGMAAGSISADDVSLGIFYDSATATGSVEGFVKIQ